MKAQTLHDLAERVMRHWGVKMTLLCSGAGMLWASHRIIQCDRLALPHPSSEATWLFLGGLVLMLGALLWCGYAMVLGDPPDE